MTDKSNHACLWFNKNAEDCQVLYGTFPQPYYRNTQSAGDYPSGKAGDVLTVEFTVLASHSWVNGGPEFPFDEPSRSRCFTDTQEETDRYWKPSSWWRQKACAVGQDKFGLKLANYAARVEGSVSRSSRAAASAHGCMMTMKKIDIAKIEAHVAMTQT
jgi:predicted 3-demethylubiquinone-9 3-methyltransferase (glyoxalase superfamily)